MVTTRGMSSAIRRERKHRRRAGADEGEGSKTWFTKDQGLNGRGFIPGMDLTNKHCSKAEYVEFWGRKNYHNGGRYKKRVSPRMVRRIRYLYQRVFQRPIGAADAIPYQFGRGILAERKGIPIDWAGYARKMTHRGTGDLAHIGGGDAVVGGLTKKGAPFVFTSMETLRTKTPAHMWPKNEVGSETDEEEGSDNDWEVNVIHAAVRVMEPLHTDSGVLAERRVEVQEVQPVAIVERDPGKFICMSQSC